MRRLLSFFVRHADLTEPFGRGERVFRGYYVGNTGLLSTTAWQLLVQKKVNLRVLSANTDFKVGFNSLFDFCLAILPITFLWNLQMTARKKIGLAIILGLGLL